MAKEKQSRPILVWVISIVFSFMAISQIITQSLLLFLNPALQVPEVQSVIASWSLLDRISPFVLAVVLLVSTIQLFRLQKNSINWLGAYICLSVLLSIQQALTTTWLDHYGLEGLLSALGGIIIFIVALGYMMWLKKKDLLR